MIAHNIDAVLARLRAFAAHRDWAPSRFAVEAGLAPNTLRDFHSPDWNPRPETIRKLEALIPADWQPPATTSPEAAA